MDKQIIHVDMDAFFAAVEVRDAPELCGKPLIIGALPDERGVVSTCSYEARVFGVRSGMSIKDAYRACPDGVYKHPNIQKYRNISAEIHTIWNEYTDMVECVALDEGYLDVTGSSHLYGDARSVAHEIKRRVLGQTGLTCSAGLGYNMMSAKLASEEKKPDGYFEIASMEQFCKLIAPRDVGILYGVGKKTAQALHKAGFHTVKDIQDNPERLMLRFQNQGKRIVDSATGIDLREVTPRAIRKSIGKEHTFQKDIKDFDVLEDALLLIANELAYSMHRKGIFGSTITLKVTYWDMKGITRSKSGTSTDRLDEIFAVAKEMLSGIEKKPVRLVGISLSGLSSTGERQISFEDLVRYEHKEVMDGVTYSLKERFGKHSIKTAKQLAIERRLKEDKQ